MASPPHRRWRRTLVRLLAVTGLVLGGTTLSSSAAEDPRYPGLPQLGPASAIVARGSALNHATQAQQWIRLPPLYNIPDVRSRNQNDPSCRRLRPYEDVTTYTADMFMGSTPGARVPFGEVGPFRTRTVAFGSIPVEAEVKLAQLRNAEDLPVPLAFTQTTATFCSGLGPYGDPYAVHIHTTSLTGRVEVTLTSLTLDGVPLDLTTACRTTVPATLELGAPEYIASGDRRFDAEVRGYSEEEQPNTPGNLLTTPFFNAAMGGLLAGSVDLPAFTGCLTNRGEDLSALITSALSHRENPVSVRSEAIVPSDDNVSCAAESLYTHTCPPLRQTPIPTRD